MDWSDVIRVVQAAAEVRPGSAPLRPAAPPVAVAESVMEPALTGGGDPDATSADPFAQRLI